MAKKKLSDLPNDINTVSKTLLTNLGRRVISVALDLHTGLTRVNPKKTGRSAGSWHMSFNAPVWGVVEPPPGSEANPEAFVAERVALEQANVLGGAPGWGIDFSIYITNNTEYIGPLNAGSSPQANPMWIENEISRVQQSSAGIRLLDGKIK